MEERMKLKNRVAIITGGGKGMGIDFVRAFAKEGAKIAVCGRTISTLEKVVDEVKGMGTEAIAASMDVTDETSVESTVEKVLNEFDRVDILVNTAGTIGPIETIATEVPVAAFEKIWRINTLGTFITNKAVLKKMIPQKTGVIVNIAGTSGLRGYKMRVGYSSSKWGVVGITKTLALEMGQYNIRVNAIAPGATRGERIDTICREKAKTRGWTFEEVEKEYCEDMPIGRLIEPSEQASVGVFLASDDSSAITGQVIAVDGGWTAK
jgi:3-oxoacyl-[acyl-carrier protein] reductase